MVTLPALLLVVLSLAGLWRRLGVEAERRTAKAVA